MIIPVRRDVGRRPRDLVRDAFLEPHGDQPGRQKTGELVLRYPDEPTHPEQAYQATRRTRE